MDVKNNTRPKVLLLGNGLNRAFSGYSWEASIKKMWQNSQFSADSEDVKKLPFPLQIVLATGDRVDKTLIEGKNSIFPTIRDNAELSELCKKILSFGFDHILTTNYTYELESAAYPNVKNIENYIAKNQARHTDKVPKAESKYMLHTYYEVGDNKIWHIHGEVRKPDSIILGHYYYGKLLSQIQNELEKRKDYQLLRQIDEKKPIIDSWVDAFIMGDVYILGFGCDFSEMDIWWLLNRKKREAAEHGQVYFYEPSHGHKIKHGLLSAYDVKVKDLGFVEEKIDYKAFYLKALQDICN